MNGCFPAVFCDLLHLSSELSFICQHSPPSLQQKEQHLWRDVEVCYLTPPKSTPYSAFSWQLYSSPCLSLVDSQFSSALIFKVRLKMSAFLWNCRFLRITWLLLYDGDAQVHYPRLLLSEISSFQRPSRLKQLFLHFCHLATTSSDRWGTQHVLFA